MTDTEKDEISVPNPSPDNYPKSPKKRGRRPKLPPKDNKQKTISDFFTQVKPQKVKDVSLNSPNSLNQATENNILYTNIRSL